MPPGGVLGPDSFIFFTAHTLRYGSGARGILGNLFQVCVNESCSLLSELMPFDVLLYPLLLIFPLIVAKSIVKFTLLCSDLYKKKKSTGQVYGCSIP